MAGLKKETYPEGLMRIATDGTSLLLQIATEALSRVKHER